MIFSASIVFLSLVAGAVASVAGFGIGSLLTPFLALRYGANLAIAAVSIAHFLGTLLRFWKTKSYIDRKAFIHFGILSAAGALTGAIFHAFIASEGMALILGAILILAGAMGIFGLSEKIKLTGPSAWAAGALSGFFGGLVGNQGGIRSTALLGFDLSKQAYVATATAIGLIVDICRLPVYLALEMENILRIWPFILMMSLGTMAGTLLGNRLLSKIPERNFKRIVSGVVLSLGIFTIVRAIFE